jgi:cytochrome c oxidase subunit IV
MSDVDTSAFQQQVRRCGVIFAAVACVTLLMVGTAYAPLGAGALRIGLILAAAAVNASLVGGYLMHLFSERRAIYAVLVFTAIFFVALMGLSVWAQQDHPVVAR